MQEACGDLIDAREINTPILLCRNARVRKQCCNGS